MLPPKWGVRRDLPIIILGESPMHNHGKKPLKRIEMSKVNLRPHAKLCKTAGK